LVGWYTNDAGEKRQGVQRTFGQGGKDTAENLLGVSTSGCSIAAEDLAVDDQRTNGLFGGPVRRLDVRLVKKRQDLIAMPSQVLLKLSIAVMREMPFQQTVPSFLQSAARHGQPAQTDEGAVSSIAKRQRIAQQWP